MPPEQLEIYPYLRQITDQGYVLFGGTALTLQLGHRTSVDFDFFSAEKVNKEVLRHLRGLEIAEVL
ncbi:nucleotidyl transferase AbiEii/AbiGii toxin family protein [Helicobacter suis]|uniref:nucleotidyl transferase AbiEii/AbiGii toxin family protein n=1 Tax=Helicobacter suis TaxID=104628 RepID=UPI0024937724|nr:nucleotidyl transferase AbiEii/AbiGii toxin family protein [Helicobacter suis]